MTYKFKSYHTPPYTPPSLAGLCGLLPCLFDWQFGSLLLCLHDWHFSKPAPRQRPTQLLGSEVDINGYLVDDLRLDQALADGGGMVKEHGYTAVTVLYSIAMAGTSYGGATPRKSSTSRGTSCFIKALITQLAAICTSYQPFNSCGPLVLLSASRNSFTSTITTPPTHCTPYGGALHQSALVSASRNSSTTTNSTRKTSIRGIQSYGNATVPFDPGDIEYAMALLSALCSSIIYAFLPSCFSEGYGGARAMTGAMVCGLRSLV